MPLLRNVIRTTSLVRGLVLCTAAWVLCGCGMGNPPLPDNNFKKEDYYDKKTLESLGKTDPKVKSKAAPRSTDFRDEDGSHHIRREMRRGGTTK